MSAADRALKLDVAEACRLGVEAVKLAAAGTSGKMVTLVRGKGKAYSASFGTANLSDVAVHAKPMPANMLTSDGFYVTKAFMDYARPLVGEMPETVRLSFKKAKPAKK